MERSGARRFDVRIGSHGFDAVRRIGIRSNFRPRIVAPNRIGWNQRHLALLSRRINAQCSRFLWNSEDLGQRTGLISLRREGDPSSTNQFTVPRALARTADEERHPLVLKILERPLPSSTAAER